MSSTAATSATPAAASTASSAASSMVGTKPVVVGTVFKPPVRSTAATSTTSASISSTASVRSSQPASSSTTVTEKVLFQPPVRSTTSTVGSVPPPVNYNATTSGHPYAGGYQTAPLPAPVRPAYGTVPGVAPRPVPGVASRPIPGVASRPALPGVAVPGVAPRPVPGVAPRPVPTVSAAPEGPLVHGPIKRSQHKEDEESTTEETGTEEDEKRKKLARVKRLAAGKVWYDNSLDEWPEGDFRIFVGDIGPDINDEILTNFFKEYPSFAKARVVMDKRMGVNKGYAFVSFLDPHDGMRALREKNGKYMGARPVKLRKSNWQERALATKRAQKKSRRRY